jgi:hypothetical protein
LFDRNRRTGAPFFHCAFRPHPFDAAGEHGLNSFSRLSLWHTQRSFEIRTDGEAKPEPKALAPGLHSFFKIARRRAGFVLRKETVDLKLEIHALPTLGTGQNAFDFAAEGEATRMQQQSFTVAKREFAYVLLTPQTQDAMIEQSSVAFQRESGGRMTGASTAFLIKPEQ